MKAIKMYDGKIYFDKKAIIHAEVIIKYNLNYDDIISKGYVIDGKYEASEYLNRRK
jgi:hypothetical protein